MAKAAGVDEDEDDDEEEEEEEGSDANLEKVGLDN